MKSFIPENTKVKFTHLRFFPDGGVPWTVFDAKRSGFKASEFDPMQGITVCRIYDSEKNLLASGQAVVNPGKDHFSKKIGRNISLGRALKQIRGN
jgi:hypothetical protein